MATFETMSGAGRWFAMLFCLHAGIGVTTIAVLMPPFQAADELAHFERADQVAGGGLVATRYDGGAASGGTIDLADDVLAAPFDAIRFHPERKVTRAMLEAAARVRRDGRGLQSFPNTAIYPPFLYFPAALGLVAGHAAGWSVLHTLVLSRLLDGVASVAIGALAIAWAGPAAPLLFAILCLPMSLALFASVSQDGPMIASGALAAVLLARAADAAGGRRGACLTGGCIALALVGMARPAYLPLVLLPLLVPRVPLGWRVGGTAAATGAIVTWIALTDRMTLFRPEALQVARQMHAALAHPGLWPAIAAGTIRVQLAHHLPYVQEFVGVLGWLDTPLPAPFYAVALAGLALALVLSLPPQPRLAPGPRLLAGLLLAAAALAVFVLQYLSWSPVGASYVEGVQGRYFLPVAVFLPLVLPHLRRPLPARAVAAGRLVLGFAPCLSIAVTIRAIVLRYYL